MSLDILSKKNKTKTTTAKITQQSCQINACWHIYKGKNPCDAPTITSDIKPFMLWLMPTQRQTRPATDLAVDPRHRWPECSSPPALPFLSTKVLPRTGPNPPDMIHPMGKAFSLIIISDRPMGELWLPPTQPWYRPTALDQNECPVVVLSFLFSTVLLQLGLMAHWPRWRGYETFCLWHNNDKKNKTSG